MDLATAQADLAAVRAAIAKAQNAQSYSGDGRSLNRANLETLYRERDRLEALVGRLSGDDGFLSRGVVSGLGETAC